MVESANPLGWDAKAISAVANNRFGGFAEMFEYFGWEERGAVMMRVVQKKVADTFGTVQKFVDVYDGSASMPPIEAIEGDPPNVWLTSAWGFEPEKWGCITFPNESALKSFLRRSDPGCLMVTYDTGRLNPALKGKVRGVTRSTHEVAHTRDLLTPEAWIEKQNDPEMRDRWPYAVRIDGAWAITQESQPNIADFADETYTPGRGRVIGSKGMPLSSVEARKLLTLDFCEVNIARMSEVCGSVPASGVETFSPSRAGPVSKKPHSHRESEGPKHVYVLQLSGDANVFLGKDVEGGKIFKVGISRSPAVRCDGLNRAFPKGVFQWEIFKSTYAEGKEPYPDSKLAIAVENLLKAKLVERGASLGGEFFVVGDKGIETAWFESTNEQVR